MKIPYDDALEAAFKRMYQAGFYKGMEFACEHLKCLEEEIERLKNTVPSSSG